MDDEMLEKYCPWVLGLPKLMLDTMTGDGLKMGLWVGAAIEGSPHCAMLHFNSTNEEPVIHYRPVGMMNRAAFLYLNKLGERIIDESLSDEFLANIVLRQPGKSFFQVFDAAKASYEVANLNQAIMCNPRNAYQRYNAAINTTDRVPHTNMGTLLPNRGNISFSGAGVLNP